ncbi:GntR family transcriptional regulator [Herbidospora solisilvae]|nr:GntR family transcriptional regulator [Herbidospora solisilvae]
MSPKLGYREIADHIRQGIVSGAYPTGTALPAEPELAAEFNASRSLVNRAMQVLAAEGLVRPRQGRGTIVTWLPPMTHSAARYARSTREAGGARGAFDAEIRALGLEPQHEIRVERTIPPQHIAEILGLDAGEESALVRRRRLLASGIPVRLNASWFPLEIAAGTVLEAEGPVIVGGVKTALAELGYPQTEGTERFTIRSPQGHEIDDLEISPERTVIDMVHIGRTESGRAVEVTTTVTPAHYLVVESTFPLA